MSNPTKMPYENFGGALALLREGRRVRRAGWNGKGMHIQLVQAASFSQHSGPHLLTVSTSPFLAIYTAQGTYMPWVTSQADVLAEDWELAE